MTNTYAARGAQYIMSDPSVIVRKWYSFKWMFITVEGTHNETKVMCLKTQVWPTTSGLVWKDYDFFIVVSPAHVIYNYVAWKSFCHYFYAKYSLKLNAILVLCAHIWGVSRQHIEIHIKPSSPFSAALVQGSYRFFSHYYLPLWIVYFLIF